MRAEDHQSQWFSFGVVLFGGGVVVSADWVFAVKSAPFDNHLSFTEWPIWLWIGMMLAGCYIMLASYIEKWFLPGKSRVTRAKQLRYVAEADLALFRVIGSQMMTLTDVTPEEISDWGMKAKGYVFDTWGPAEGGVLHGAMFQNPTSQTIIDVNRSLDDLVARSSILLVTEKVVTGNSNEWQGYLKTTRFLKLIDGGTLE